jgi:hypothetical protein
MQPHCSSPLRRVRAAAHARHALPWAAAKGQQVPGLHLLAGSVSMRSGTKRSGASAPCSPAQRASCAARYLSGSSSNLSLGTP